MFSLPKKFTQTFVKKIYFCNLKVLKLTMKLKSFVGSSFVILELKKKLRITITRLKLYTKYEIII